MTNMEDVLTKVLDRTREGKIVWRDTGVTNKFVATIGDSVMYVEERGSLYSFVVFNSKGVEMGRLGVGGIGKRVLLSELLDLARNQALGVEKHLSGLMSALDRV